MEIFFILDQLKLKLMQFEEIFVQKSKNYDCLLITLTCCEQTHRQTDLAIELTSSFFNLKLVSVWAINHSVIFPTESGE